jgi:NAD-dependent dihydropyrimidine dehydrogenase PreA subunit
VTKLDDHPSVVRFRQSEPRPLAGRIDVERLRRICLDAGADDVGFVAIDRHELDDQRAEILGLYPWTKGLISLVCRMNREPIRSPARSVANLEFHHVGDHTNEVASEIVSVLEAEGFRAVNPSMGFPMEMGRFPDKVWVVSHKPVAVAAGLGQMGIHRNVIHPKFGNFILLATVLVDAEIAEQSRPIDYNPCLECKLCVAACPVGAIAPDGHFDFSACLTHNYREFMGGFTDWVEQVADSKNARDYRSRVEDSETVSIWQSLGFGPNYKAAYCMAACPAGDDVIGPFLGVRRPRLGRRGVRFEAVPPQEAQAGRWRPSARVDPDLPVRPPSRLPEARLGGPGRHVPLRIHRGGARRGDGHHPRQVDPGRAGARRHRRPPHRRRQPDLARFPGEGAEPRLGLDPQEDPPEGASPSIGRLRALLPVLRSSAMTLESSRGIPPRSVPEFNYNSSNEQ